MRINLRLPLVYSLVLAGTLVLTPALKEGDRFQTDRESPVTLPLPEEDDSFVFAVFGDRTGGPDDGVKILAQAVDDVNLVDPDLVMTVGDLVQGYNQTPRWQKQADEFSGIMDELTCPWYPVAGNHDVYWRGEGRPAEEHEGNYERHFGPLWYSFRHKDCWFITLYTDEGDPDTGIRAFNMPASQRMSAAQLKFLDGALERAKDARHVFVFLHHPRWRGGNYGSDWDKVHERLAQAGNVTAVFAGHIHRMVYDGLRDGIEYFTLATVGGGQKGDAPEAGYLHHWNLVTVRDGKIAVSTFPVGAAMDPRLITDEVGRAARTLIDSVQPGFVGTLRLDARGAVDEQLMLDFENPLKHDIEVSVSAGSADARWRIRPDHGHLVIPAGQSRHLPFRFSRGPGGIDEGFRAPAVHLQFDYLAETHRVSLPTREVRVPLVLDGLTRPSAPDREVALRFDGKRDCLAVSHGDLNLPDGPFTVECWFNADRFGKRVGLINKTESAEFGVFLDGGTPKFIVHLGGRYESLAAPAPALKTGRWIHVAGVFDGAEMRLYLEGKLVASRPASGVRTTRAIPMLIGADPDGSGRGGSFFEGRIDEVRISRAARYSGPSFAPELVLEADDETQLLLHLDAVAGEWVFDSSPDPHHPTLRGRPTVVSGD